MGRSATARRDPRAAGPAERSLLRTRPGAAGEPSPKLASAQTTVEVESGLAATASPVTPSAGGESGRDGSSASQGPPGGRYAATMQSTSSLQVPAP